MRRIIARHAHTLTVVALAAALTVVVTASPAQASTSPFNNQPSTSTGTLGPAAVNAPITRTQMLARAAEWTTQPTSYDSSEGWTDAATGGPYRIDCSGFVSMAWGLSRSYVTSASHGSPDFNSWTGKSYLGGADAADYEQLQPGDALLGVAFGHMVLFDKWATSDHTSMWIYEEESTNHDALLTKTSRQWYIDNGFRPIRYNNIAASPTVIPDGGLMADFNGDGKPDVAAMSASGESLYITDNTTSTGGTPTLAAGAHVSDGWSTVSHLTAVDFDGDGLADLIGVSGDSLLLWRNTTPHDGTAFTFAPYTVLSGSGNDTVSRFLAPADYNGDGRPDIAAFSSNGDQLFITPNTSTPGNPSVGTPVFVSGGWKTVDHMMTADFDGDGKADIIGRNGDSLLLWRSTGVSTFTFAPYVTLSTGNATVTKYLGPADFDGDGRPDIAALGSGGDALYLTRNTSTPGHPSVATGSLISTGWKSVDDMMVGDAQADGRSDIWGRSGDALLEWSSTSTSSTFSFAAYRNLSSGNSTVSAFLTRRPVA